ncbi:hypothetical protein ELD05_11365 [Caldicellulosiruptor changbaiensis]|uniref:Uncharacterized protein n=1 Tax=Caldicellulosiruptor changbaiensis TaxID=1222016 RepID=A0A3T0D868_9FIRM|nr:hypothetical protein [Caldicellulosiruptor changbaiensis]AZT91178.1 hypothetical protein ELD05_11365 [Caldicellulosiruptor changbaiensis]
MKVYELGIFPQDISAWDFLIGLVVVFLFFVGFCAIYYGILKLLKKELISRMTVVASVVNFISLGWAVLVRIVFQYILETDSGPSLDHRSTFLSGSEF